jgi:hypothetical protein
MTIIELCIILFGYIATFHTIAIAFNALATQFTGATLLVAVVMVLAVLANLGIFILALLSSSFGALFLRSFRNLPKPLTGKLSWVNDVINPIPNLALQMYKDNPDYYLEYQKLRSLAVSELTLNREMEPFIKSIKAHMSTIQNFSEAIALSYYQGLTQTQSLFDRIDDDLRTLWSVLVVMLMGIPSIFLLPVSISSRFIAIVLLVVISLSVLPILFRRKRFFAVMQIIGYIDSFSMGPADVEDREGEPIL